MLKRKLVAGNWKMNPESLRDAVSLAEAVGQGVEGIAAEMAVFPPAPYLPAVIDRLRESPVWVGGQNAWREASGAFTGETSPTMLADLGCRGVLLGHSERRHVLEEDDGLIARKVHAALQAGLIPIVCVGETLDEREAGRTGEVVRTQFEASLDGVGSDAFGSIVLAYEPVWAIGTGKTATSGQAQEVHADLRSLVESRYNSELAAGVRILYGGSVKPENAAELMDQADVDGVLVGGASLKADSFLAIARAAG